VRPLRFRSFATFLLAMHVAGCVYWQPATVPPQRLIEDEQPSQVRVTTLDGARLVFRSPEIRSDSLAGGGTRPTQLAVPISQIGSLEVQRFSAGRTVGLIFLIGVTALAATFVYLVTSICESGTC